MRKLREIWLKNYLIRMRQSRKERKARLQMFFKSIKGRKILFRNLIDLDDVFKAVTYQIEESDEQTMARV